MWGRKRLYRRGFLRVLGILAFVGVVSVIVGSAPFLRLGQAGLGDCSQPVSDGPNPTASDCLFILRVAVGSEVCTPDECICAPKGTLPTTATDALLCLMKAVGQDVALNCPCVTPNTTTTTVHVGTTTSTSLILFPTTSTSTTLLPPITTTTTALPTTTTTLSSRFTCESAQAPECDGTCPDGSVCLPGELGCFCEPVGCGDYQPAPECAGLCPFPEVCIEVSGDCACVLVTQLPDCESAGAPTCDGNCPDGSFCGPTFFADPECSCMPVLCGDMAAAPLCLGLCAEGSVCRDEGGACQCGVP